MARSSLLPRVVLVLAIVATVAAGGKSYLNKGVLEAEREDAKTQKGKADLAEAAAKKATDTAKVAGEKLKVADEAKAAAETKAVAAVADADKAKKEAADALVQVTAKEADLAAANKKLEEIAGTPEKPAVSTVDPVMKKALDEAIAAAAEKETVAKTFQVKAEDAEKKAASLEADNLARQKQLTKPGLEGKVLAVNPNWSFVVLSIGDRQGVVNGSSLIVKRGGVLVAKLRVTSVEPSTSIADIQAGSTAKGSTVQPGDVVIFPGS